MSPRNAVLGIVLACTLTALASTQALIWWGARSAHDQRVVQRDSYLLHSLRTAAENYLAIGLSLEQMTALQSLIERERASFAQVQAIDVFAANGRLLYSTDLSGLGSQVPEPWRSSLAGSAPWRRDEAGQRQLGTRFDNDLGQAAGGIVLTVSTSASTSAVTLAQWQARGQAALQLLAVLALVSLSAWWGATLGLRRLLAPYARVARILQNHPAHPVPSAAPRQTPLEQAAHRTSAAWSTAQQHAQQRLLELQELDDAQ